MILCGKLSGMPYVINITKGYIRTIGYRDGIIPGRRGAGREWGYVVMEEKTWITCNKAMEESVGLIC